MKKKLVPWLFLAPSLTGVGIFVLIPFLDVIRRSFCDAMGSHFIGLENYRQVWENQAFLMAGGNTMKFLVTCIPLLLLLSLFMALLLGKQSRSRDTFKSLFLLPVAIPIASTAFLWRVFFQENGLINALLVSLGKEPVRFLTSSCAFGVLVFSYLWKNTGYHMILWIAGLGSIPKSLYEAARVDGAGGLSCFFYITLPSLRGFAVMIAILSFINSFKVFREAYLVAGSYPDESIYMLQHLFNNWFLSLDIQKMSAAAVMLAGAILLASGLLLHLGNEEKE